MNKLSCSLVIISLCMILPAVLASDEITGTTKFLKCNYLRTEVGQKNAYIRNNTVCCMCPAGKYLAQDCNDNDPASTVCEPCHYSKDDPYDRYYIHFQAHMQNKCYMQSGIFCPLPLIIVEGSTTKEASCGCPAGFELASNSKKCIKAQEITENGLITKILKSTTTTGHRKVPQTAKAVTTTTSTPIFSTGIDPTTTIRSPSYPKTFNDSRPTKNPNLDITVPLDQSVTEQVSTDVIHKEDTMTITFIGMLVLGFFGFGFLAFLGFLAWWCCWRRQDHETTDIRVAPGDETSPTSSSAGLLKNSKEEITVFYEAQERIPAANRTDPIPIDQLDQNNRHQNQAPAEDAAENHPLLQGQQEGVVNQVIPTRDEQEKNRSLVKTLATKFGTEILSRDVKRVFRPFLDSETVIDDLFNKYEANTPELVYKLMMEAQNRHGMQLTPQFILERLRSLRDTPQNLIDITEDEIRTSL